ncbi:MAG TPA: tetratricopeptide repeat protein [Steroidobacteraceae bacterium]|nr:tetratricopeptide repeat protein [Steroidobacteraceae bacterium]
MRARLVSIAFWVLVALAGCAAKQDAAQHISSAKDQMAKKEYGHAIIELKHALRIDPSNAQARILLGECYLDNGLPKDALDELDGLPNRYSSTDVLGLRARATVAVGRFEEALSELDSGNGQIPEPSRSLIRAQALQGLHRYDESDAALNAAIAAGENGPWPRALLIENLAARGEFAAAAESARQLTDEYPQSGHAWLIRGNVAARRGELSRADEYWIKAREYSVQLTAQQVVALNFSLAEARLSRNDPAGALPFRDQLLRMPAGRVLGEFIQARVLMENKKYLDATAKLREVLRMSPDFRPASVLLGAALLADGHAAEAEVQIKEMLSADPKDLALRKLLARARLRQGRPRDAMTAIQPALEYQSSDGDLDALATIAPLELARLASDEDDWNHAAAWLEQSRVRDPSQFDARIALAYLYFQRGRLDDAKVILVEAMRIAGDSSQRWQSLGTVYANAGQLQPALTCLRRAVESKGADARAWLLLARAQLSADDIVSAHRSALKALEFKPDSLSANGMLGVIEARDGNLRGALERLKRVDEKAAPVGALNTWKGEIYAGAKQYSQAAAAYEAALDAGAGREVALKAAQARREAGIKPYYIPLEKWRSNHPEDIGVAMMLAQACLETGESQKATLEYESILRSQPKNVGALNNLAWLYQQAHDPKALPTARQAYSIAGNSPLIADTLGWILLGAGKGPEALEVLRSAAQSAPDHAEIQFHYASALAQTGDTDLATQITRRLLATHQSFSSRADAERLLAQLTGR